MKSDAIAIIPARSGSVGLPGKNVSLLGGYPLISYSIAAAKLAGIKRVLVSTDSQEYAEIAQFYGAEVPFLRPSEISKDKSTDFEFMLHAMEWIDQNESYIPEYWAHLRPTTPLRKPKIIRSALSAIKQHSEATSLRSGYEVAESPFKWFLKDENGYFIGLRDDLTPEKVNLPRQVFPKVYNPDGYIDIVRSSNVLNNSNLHGDKMLVFQSPQTVEIDTRSDFEYLSYQFQQNGSELHEYLKEFN